MGKTYEVADERDMSVLELAMRKWHPDLDECEAKIAVVMVEPNKTEGGEPTAPAVSFAGAEAPCRMYLEPTSRRVHSGIDARLFIDAERWKDLDRDEKLAVCDHGLSWLTVKKRTSEESAGEEIVRHDDGRPKLLMAKPDAVIWYFTDVLKRHGTKSFEYNRIDTFKTLTDEHGQKLWDFGTNASAEAEVAETEPDGDTAELGITDAELAADGARPGKPRDDGFESAADALKRMNIDNRALTGPAAEQAHKDRTRGKAPRRAAAKKPERRAPRRNGNGKH